VIKRKNITNTNGELFDSKEIRYFNGTVERKGRKQRGFLFIY